LNHKHLKTGELLKRRHPPFNRVVADSIPTRLTKPFMQLWAAWALARIPSVATTLIPVDDSPAAEGTTLLERSVYVARRTYPLSKVYGLLEAGPVVLLTTSSKGRANVMAQSWHTMIDFEPPTVACVVSNRNFTFSALRATKECVINIPTVELAQKVVACGNTSGRDIDKFEAFGLTPVAASRVRAPLIAECYCSLECKVVDTRDVNRYCLFILEVVKAWIDPAKKQSRTIHHMGRGAFIVAGRTIKLPSRMK
jgi:flavin reductase (DIM6/NTAB) family NADH-FMN oxidoreductase RutF